MNGDKAKAITTDFVALVGDAYHHLYDLVALRAHPLGFMLNNGRGLTAKERAWRLHHLLIEAVQELQPTEQSPPQSREWRRYQLLKLRYIEALAPQQVAEKMYISRRQYFREQAGAIEALAQVLQTRRTDHQPSETTEEKQPLLDELERVSKHEQTADLVAVMKSVLTTLDRVIEDKHFTITFTSPAEAIIAVGRSLLRQFLFGVMGVLLAQPDGTCVEIQIHSTQQGTRLQFKAPTVSSVNRLSNEPWFHELSGRFRRAGTQVQLSGESEFNLVLNFCPGERSTRAVLIIDDNADMLALYERFLDQGDYAVTLSQDIEQAYEVIRTQHPFAVILDLMLPEHDGWDLLARLKHDPTTTHCPIIVCSVLKQDDLALAMGAAHFLPKPVTRSALLAALDGLRQDAQG